jgi:transcriptional regulator CtsR
MIEKLKSTYDILNKLEELNSKKFISEDIKNINELLNGDLLQYDSIDKLSNSSVFSDEEKKLISNIISKIDILESKVLPKANLISSFFESVR